MREHPNAALVGSFFDAFTRGSYVQHVSELLADDVVWHLPGTHPLSGDHAGKDAVLAAMRRFEELSAGTIRTELHDVTASDQHAGALLLATGKRGDKRYDLPEADIFHIRDGTIVEFWSFSQDQRLTDEFWS